VKKIANIIFTSSNGGAETVFIDYIKILENLGHKNIAIIKDSAPYEQELSRIHIPTIKIKNNFGYYDFFAIKNIKKTLDEFDANIAIAHGGRATYLTKMAIGKVSNTKLISVNHSMNIKRSLVADVILSVNKEIFYRTIDSGRSEKNSFIVPNTIDLSDCSQPSDVNLRDKNTITLGVIGRLAPEKNFSTAIKALKNLSQISDKNFVLNIAGSGCEANKLKALCKKLGVSDRVNFLGWISDKKAFFEGIDIFLIPSLNESFGLVILEAMKYRKPIISTTCDGPKEILRPSDGILIDFCEKLDEKIASSVLKLISNPDLLNSMVESSFARVKEKYSREKLISY
jgi:glycosyltransferase involved in cell wall biosynthesis